VNLVEVTQGADLLDRAARGDILAVSRLITAFECGSSAGAGVVGDVYARTGRAKVVGLTGVPGSGKSTLAAALVRQFRELGQTVAVVAVDPSSSISGGAILGDRIRMNAVAGDSGVFVRSMASRRALGGLAAATADAVAVLDACGWDVVIVETVGAGQAEVEIARLAPTVIVVSVPGLGDEIQAIKAGLLEIADIHVVNKSDHPGAHRATTELRLMLRMKPGTDAGAWPTPVLQTIATDGTGLAELRQTVEDHQQWLRATGELARRARTGAGARLRAITGDLLLRRFRNSIEGPDFDRLVDDVVNLRLDPYTAAAEIVSRLIRPEESVKSGASADD
jgi:LAO/AO transport system kinase